MAVELAAHPADRQAPNHPPEFARDLAPVLVERCLKCHGPDQPKGGYRLDTPALLLKAGESGKPPITPGQPDASHLFQLLVTSDEDDRMPQKSARLEDAVLALFRRWIESGASLPGLDPARPLTELPGVIAFPPPPQHFAHPVPITAVEWISPDVLAVGGFREITLWSPQGSLVRRLGSVPERIHALRLHPDPHRLFFAGGSPGRNGSAGVLDLREPQSTPRRFSPGPDVLLALALSPDGRLVAVAGTERNIVVFDALTLEPRHVLTGHSDWVLDLAFSPDGRRLASASRDRTARVFEVGTGMLVSAFRDHNESVAAVCFIDDATVATAGRDGRIRTWESATAKAIRSSKPVDAEPTRVGVQNGLLTSLWTDGKVREATAKDLDTLAEFGTPGEPLLSLGWSPSSGQLAVGGYDGRVRPWKGSREASHGGFVATPGLGTNSSVAPGTIAPGRRPGGPSGD